MAVDSCEPEVIAALEKQGWRVKAKPLYLRTGDRQVAADLALSRRHDDHEEYIIVVEVKCFPDDSRDLHEFYTAMGQYQTSEDLLQHEPSQPPIYLAIPDVAYDRLLHIYNVVHLFELHRINLVIINLDTAEIVRWMIWPQS